ncbi:MAG: PKD domain-containing protein [Candidatus Bathyarchaeota archaeon]|nr:PKD domain-containing protein [Candidatus Bathyarchaeota archaeon]
MRKITKIRRCVRAISPVISVLLMIAIAVVASLVAYAWVMGYMNFQTSKAGNAIQIPSFAAGSDADPDDTDRLRVYVQNVGEGTVKVGTVYVNDIGVGILSPDDLSIGKGATIELLLDLNSPWSAGQTVKIKVVTTDGTFMEMTGKIPSASNPSGNIAPIARFSSSTNDLTANFDASASSDPDGSIVSYAWNFGDSQTGSGVTTSHTYSAAGTYNVVLTVTDNEGATGTVSHGVTVTEPTEPPHMSSFAVSAPSSVTAGSSFSVTVTAKDQFGNTFSSYSGTVTLTSGDSQAVLPSPLAISGGSGTFTGVVLKTSGSQSLTATAGSYTGSTNVAVEHAAAASFDVTPATAVIGAGSAQAYTGTATDLFGNSWVVSASTAWGITTGAGGSWANNVYTSEVVGTWTVTGTYLTFTDTATLEVTFGAVDHITVSPASQSLTAGESQAYTARAYDALGNNWDVTATASWSITTGAEGSWTGNTYTCAKAGTWTVTAQYSGKSATSQLEVTRGDAASITVTPASETIVAGESQEYTAMADDGYGNTWDITDSVAWDIDDDAGGSWTDNTYTSSKAGTWTVQATYDTTLTDTAELTVTAGALHHFVFDTITSPKTVGTPFSITITAKDAFENTVTSYVGTNTLTVSAGTISITTTTAFTGGVWTGDVSITPTGDDITISTAASADNTKTGISNAFDVNPATVNLFYDPFTTGFDSAWTSGGGPYRLNTNPAPGTSGGYYAVLEGSDSGTDDWMIVTIDTTGYGSISLNYWRSPSSLETGDHLYIEWRVGTVGTWTQIEDVTSGSWTPHTFNFPATADDTIIQIQIRVLGRSGDYGLVDDVLVTGTPLPPRTTIFSDDFESDWQSEWTHSDSDIQTSQYHSSNHAARLYVSGSTQGFITLQISTTGYTSIQLNYWRLFDRTGTSADYLIIEWRVGSSGTWTNLETLNSDMTSWGQSGTFNLNGAENQATIQIRFRLQDCEGTGGGGPDYGYIDDVIITGRA